MLLFMLLKLLMLFQEMSWNQVSILLFYVLALTMKTKTARVSFHVDFIVNHPFVFALTDKSNNIQLFIGRVAIFWVNLLSLSEQENRVTISLKTWILLIYVLAVMSKKKNRLTLPPVDFKAVHPFVFILNDSSSNGLFFGRVVSFWHLVA